MPAARDNTGKPALSQLHWFEHGLKALAEHCSRGRAKYPDAEGVPNWTLGGKPDEEYLDAIERHLGELVRGETHDLKPDHKGVPGLGTLHAAAIAWNALALITLNQNDLPVYRDPSDRSFLDHMQVEGDYDWIDGKLLTLDEGLLARAAGFVYDQATDTFIRYATPEEPDAR